MNTLENNKASYVKNDALIPITSLAGNLGLIPKKETFDEDTYIPITMLPANDLFVSEEYQRLISMMMIKGAKRFDADLVRPLYVFKRPDAIGGKYSVADGQHTTIMGILYTSQGGKLLLPCQVKVHPSHYTDEDCIAAEANLFKLLNVRRRNVGKIDRLRADIAMEDELALKILDALIDMGVNIENIGDPKGVDVHGYDKLMEAYRKYKLSNVRKSIELYQKLQKNTKFPKWNDSDKPLNGGLIGGIAAVFYLLKEELGVGDKYYALNYYLDNYLGKAKPKELLENTAGVAQDILIARRIVTRCNGAIELGSVTKKNGDPLQIGIGEEVMSNAGLADPSL